MVRDFRAILSLVASRAKRGDCILSKSAGFSGFESFTQFDTENLERKSECDNYLVKTNGNRSFLLAPSCGWRSLKPL